MPSIPLPSTLSTMRTITLSAALLVVTLAALAPLAHATTAAPSAHETHAGHGAATAAAPVELVDGVVRRIDRVGGKVTVAHGPLTNLNMPAMTMAFRVKDALWLDQMQVDGKIRFLAESIDGALTIVRFEAEK